MAIEDERAACCAAVYHDPAVRWLLGDELHPGGEATTRRALELIGVGPDDRLLDVACGAGTSAILAAAERGCEVVGIDLGDPAADGAGGRVSFKSADAAALPFGDASFDAVLCECSLSTFADKPRAVAEMSRVLAAGGRAAVSDVVVDRERLPAELRGPLAALACVGDALDAAGYERLLTNAGMRITAIESHDEAAARLAVRIEDRLRGARLLGFAVEEALELVRSARAAIDDGTLGYSIFAAARRRSSGV